MKISVNINGVLRNVLLKFQQVYEKYEDRDVKSDVITPNLMEYTHFDDEEKLYNFLYQEAPMEIFGQAKETFINVISHLVELYKNMPSDYKLRVVSDDLGKAKPATLWFLAKYGLVCDEIVFCDEVCFLVVFLIDLDFDDFPPVASDFGKLSFLI